MSEPLFDLPGAPEPPRSVGGRRRARMTAAVQAGHHPLTTVWPSMVLALHPDAARSVDASGTRVRCGTCAHRIAQLHHDSAYPKCTAGEGVRISRSAASDVRAMWPGCRDWTPRQEDT